MKVLKVKEWKGEEYIKPSVGLVRQCLPWGETCEIRWEIVVVLDQRTAVCPMDANDERKLLEN